MEKCCGTKRLRKSRKRRYTVRKQFPSRQKLKSHFQKGYKRRTIKRRVSATKTGCYRKNTKNGLKRFRAEENSSSDSIINNSAGEPRKKRRKGHRACLCSDNLITDFSLNTLYKNPKFSGSRESIHDSMLSPVTRWSLDSFFFNNAKRGKCSELYKSFLDSSSPLQVSNNNSSENNTTVAMVTGPDGKTREITLGEGVLMHVRMSPVGRELSLTGVDENLQSISREMPSGSRESDVEFHSCQDLKNRKFIHHVSSRELMRLKSSRNFTNLRTKRLRCAQAKKQPSSPRTGLFPQTSLTSTVEGTTPEEKDGPQEEPMDEQPTPVEGNIASTNRQITAPERKKPSVRATTPRPNSSRPLQPSYEHPTPGEGNFASTNRQITVPERKKPSVRAITPRPNSSRPVQPSSSIMGGYINRLPANDALPCTFLVFVCFFVFRLLNVL